MILAYMVAFKALNQARSLDRKVLDWGLWETLLPHFAEVLRRVRHSRALTLLTYQLNGICIEELVSCALTLDPSSAAFANPKWRGHGLKRTSIWAEAHSIDEALDESNAHLKASIGAWSTADDAVVAALKVLKQWASRDDVRWKPELLALATATATATATANGASLGAPIPPGNDIHA
jgi:hypothetical protein